MDFKTNKKESTVKEEELGRYDKNYRMFSPHAASVFDARDDYLIREGSGSEVIDEEEERKS